MGDNLSKMYKDKSWRSWTSSSENREWTSSPLFREIQIEDITGNKVPKSHQYEICEACWKKRRYICKGRVMILQGQERLVAMNGDSGAQFSISIA